MPSHLDSRSWYDESIQPYLVWSKKLNIHFGYWRWGVNPFRLESMLLEMNRQVLFRLALDSCPSPTLLDAGCGTGATLRYLARRLPSANFHGVTLSSQQVFIGEKMNAEAGLSDRIQLHEVDFQALPFPEKNFDAALLVESACYADGPGKARLANELARVLRPGARLVVVDGFRRHSRPFSPWLEKMYRQNISLWSIDELADVQLFAKNLAAAGFKNVQVENISWQVAPSALHIPLIALRLSWKSIWRSQNPAPYRRYSKALLHTFFMGAFKRHFGYFIITAEFSGTS